jgi:hypothetical protein
MSLFCALDYNMQRFMCVHFWEFIKKKFLFENDGSNLVGLLIHLLIVENFINILFLKNDGTTQQIFH